MIFQLYLTDLFSPLVMLSVTVSFLHFCGFTSCLGALHLTALEDGSGSVRTEIECTTVLRKRILSLYQE